MELEDGASAQDSVDLQALVVRYARAVDTRDYALFARCFTEQCEITYHNTDAHDEPLVFYTADDAVATIRHIHAPLDALLHRVTNHAFGVDGDRAVGRTYVDIFQVRRDGRESLTLNIIGYYDDEFLRTTEGWRFTRRCYSNVHRAGPRALGDYSSVVSAAQVWEPAG
jgi:hypothetical protein